MLHHRRIPSSPSGTEEAAEAFPGRAIQKTQDKIKAFSHARLLEAEAASDRRSLQHHAGTPTRRTAATADSVPENLLAKVEGRIKTKEAELADAQKELAAGDTKDEPASKSPRRLRSSSLTRP